MKKMADLFVDNIGVLLSKQRNKEEKSKLTWKIPNKSNIINIQVHNWLKKKKSWGKITVVKQPNIFLQLSKFVSAKI